MTFRKVPHPDNSAKTNPSPDPNHFSQLMSMLTNILQSKTGNDSTLGSFNLQNNNRPSNDCNMDRLKDQWQASLSLLSHIINHMLGLIQPCCRFLGERWKSRHRSARDKKPSHWLHWYQQKARTGYEDCGQNKIVVLFLSSLWLLRSCY